MFRFVVRTSYFRVEKQQHKNSLLRATFSSSWNWSIHGCKKNLYFRLIWKLKDFFRKIASEKKHWTQKNLLLGLPMIRCSIISEISFRSKINKKFRIFLKPLIIRLKKKKVRSLKELLLPYFVSENTKFAIQKLKNICTCLVFWSRDPNPYLKCTNDLQIKNHCTLLAKNMDIDMNINTVTRTLAAPGY